MCKILISLLFFLSLLTVSNAVVAQSSEQVTIGVTIPLSGGFEGWGESIRRAIEIFESRPENRFRFDFQDEVQGDPKKALSAYRKYRLNDTRYIIVGTMAGTKAVLPLAANDPVLLLSIGLVDEEELRQSTKLVSWATQLATESEFLGAYVTKKGFRRVAIVNRQDAFSEQFAKTLKHSLELNAAQVVSQQSVDPKESDFRPFLLRIKSTQPDAICFNVAQDRESTLVQQAKELGLSARLFSNYDFETEAVLRHEKLLSDVEYSFPKNSADGTQEKAAFDNQFKARFGEAAVPGANSYFVYDGLVLLERALSGCAAKDIQCVNQYFRSVKKFTGLAGDVSFNADGSNIRPYGIKTIRSGKFVWVETN